MNCVRFDLCPYCLQEVYQFGHPAAEILKSTCEDYCLFGITSEISASYYSDSPLFPIVEFLEKKGYIVSTETDLDSIQFRPLGLKCEESENGDVFCNICINRELHEAG